METLYVIIALVLLVVNIKTPLFVYIFGSLIWMVIAITLLPMRGWVIMWKGAFH